MKPVLELQTVTAPDAARSGSRPDLDHALWVVALDDPRLLEDHTSAWDDLAAAALEPNVFYESWMLLPALKKLDSESVRIALVFAKDRARPDNPPLLCGLFPLELKRRYKGLPLKVLTLWHYLYCSLCTPLVRADCARETLAAFFDWAGKEGSVASMIEFDCVSGDGPFQQALIDVINQRRSLSFVSNLHTRALFQPVENADSYLRAAISREHRKDLRRKERRLAQTGLMEYSEIEAEEDLPRWIEEFLALEMSGWKGRRGTAFACRENTREYFIEAVSEAFRRKKLMMIALTIDGRAIAMKCNFVSDPASFAFKIAFDEQMSASSPGLLLEIENIRRLHRRPDIKWMDSCAAPDHPMINRLWLDRKTVQTVLISSGRTRGDLIVSLMPLARWLNRRRRRRC